MNGPVVVLLLITVAYVLYRLRVDAAQQRDDMPADAIERIVDAVHTEDDMCRADARDDWQQWEAGR